MPYRDLKKTLEDFGVEKEIPDISFHKDYSGYEIILVATEIEKSGYVYYKKAQKLAGSKEMTDIFRKMADEELEHIKVLHRDIAPLFKTDNYHWENEEAVAHYLHRTLDTKVFTSPEELEEKLEDVKTREEAIDLCIDGEKKAVAFYKKVMDMTTSQEGKEAIAKILAEEKKHVEKLESFKKQSL